MINDLWAVRLVALSVGLNVRPRANHVACRSR
jgi:hypothetical protein